MRIYEDKHLNANCIVMENNNLVLKVIPNLGFKMASIKYKNKEFLFQPSLLKYEIPKFMDNFSKYDTSGLDEMIPTIDSCIYEDKFLPDHGDVWSLPWDINVQDEFIMGKVNLKSLPLSFEKRISFENENTIRMDYKVKNNSNEEQSYLWALHGLNNFNDDTEIILPKHINKVLDVIKNEIVEDEIENLQKLKLLKLYEDKKSYKFYILNEIENGECGLLYKDCNLKYTIRFDKNINPYLGLWITKGGFKGEYNCALEPSNGFYDSLIRAKSNNKYVKIMPLEEKMWTIYIEISTYGDK